MSRIDLINKHLLASPEDPFLLHALALEYVKQEDDQMARQIFEKLLEQHPDYIGSYYHLAQAYERLGKTEKAIETYKTGMEMSKQVDQHTFNELKAAFEELTTD